HLGEPKQTVQLAAMLGREFSYELLRAVSPLDEPTLRAYLKALVEREFIYQTGVIPRARYVFKHGLVQEAAYEPLLKQTRRQAHQRIAEVLAEHFPDVAESQPEVLAHHHEAGGQLEQAAEYLARAGRKALERTANREAIRHFTRALEL